MRLVERKIFPELINHLKKEEITVITGSRQTGKTTLLYQLKDYLVKQKNIKPFQIKFFNLDLITDLEGLRSQEEFIKFIKEELLKAKFLYIFIDEVQRLENPANFLKGIYDLKLPIKLIVSGSSSLEIKSKIFESLTGRKRIFYLWPFSFKEYLFYHQIEDLLTKDISQINKQKILDYLYEFIIFGGYPKVVLAKTKEEKIQLLNEIYSSYIEKDIVSFLKIKNPLIFTKLVTILADRIGGLVNSKELSNSLGINFRTIENYIFSLENTFVIKLIRPYYTNIRKELTKMPKIYFADNGLRNFSLMNFRSFLDSPEKGKLLENFVFSTLIKSFEGNINFWRTKDKNEVDFILKDYFGNIIPLEIKAVYLKEPEITRSLRSFIEKYKPYKAFIVNLSIEKTIKFKNAKIEFILPYRLESLFLK